MITKREARKAIKQLRKASVDPRDVLLNMAMDKIVKEHKIFKAHKKKLDKAWLKNIKVFAPNIYRRLARERFDGIRRIEKLKDNL